MIFFLNTFKFVNYVFIVAILKTGKCTKILLKLLSICFILLSSLYRTSCSVGERCHVGDVCGPLDYIKPCTHPALVSLHACVMSQVLYEHPAHTTAAADLRHRNLSVAAASTTIMAAGSE